MLLAAVVRSTSRQAPLETFLRFRESQNKARQVRIRLALLPDQEQSTFSQLHWLSTRKAIISLWKSTCLSTVYCETGVRGASSQPGASLGQQSYYVLWNFNVFFENVQLWSTTGRCCELTCEPKNATSEATADNVIISWQLIPSNPCYDNSYHRWTSSTTPEPQGPVLSLKYHPETSTLAFLHW